MWLPKSKPPDEETAVAGLVCLFLAALVLQLIMTPC